MTTRPVFDQARPLDRDDLARLAAADIPPGSYVNLGIGQPTRVADFLIAGSTVILHTENGMLGVGPQAYGADIDPDLINAGKIPVTETRGAVYFDHAASFAMMRGGHLDVRVLGAFQVLFTGDLANWHTGAPDAIPAVGGCHGSCHRRKGCLRADDPVHQGRFTQAHSDMQLSADGCGVREPCVYTDYGVFLLTDHGIVARETYGMSHNDLSDRLGVTLQEVSASSS